MMMILNLQGGHIKIHLHSDIPVQVDGEPWVQSPGDVVVLKSALKVSNSNKAFSLLSLVSFDDSIIGFIFMRFYGFVKKIIISFWLTFALLIIFTQFNVPKLLRVVVVVN